MPTPGACQMSVLISCDVWQRLIPRSGSLTTRPGSANLRASRPTCAVLRRATRWPVAVAIERSSTRTACELWALLAPLQTGVVVLSRLSEADVFVVARPGFADPEIMFASGLRGAYQVSPGPVVSGGGNAINMSALFHLPKVLSICLALAAGNAGLWRMRGCLLAMSPGASGALS